MFIFLNLTLHSFGPENVVSLVQIRKFKKDLIEENESYKMMYYIYPTCSIVGRKSPKTKAARTYAPTQ
jgi:hypothetical protein